MKQKFFLQAEWDRSNKAWKYHLEHRQDYRWAGYVFVQELEVSFPEPADAALKLELVQMLNQGLNKKRAENQREENEMQEQIQELLALENKAQLAEEDAFDQREARNDASYSPWYFTFGAGQLLENCYTTVYAKDYQQARRIMEHHHGMLWAFQYEESDYEDAIGKYNCAEVELGTRNAKKDEEENEF